jgi:hypothetical protein
MSVSVVADHDADCIVPHGQRPYLKFFGLNLGLVDIGDTDDIQQPIRRGCVRDISDAFCEENVATQPVAIESLRSDELHQDFGVELIFSVYDGCLWRRKRTSGSDVPKQEPTHRFVGGVPVTQQCCFRSLANFYRNFSPNNQIFQLTQRSFDTEENQALLIMASSASTVAGLARCRSNPASFVLMRSCC